MKIEEVLNDIEQRDTQLKGRLEALEKSLGNIEESHNQTQDENKALIEELRKMCSQSVEDMKKLVKATNTKLYETGKYKGEFASREQAKHFGYFVMGYVGGSAEFKGKFDEVIGRAMSGQTLTDGGVLIPEEFHPQLIEMMETYGAFRRNTQVVPIGEREATWPRLDSDVTAYIIDENTTITSSDLGLSAVMIVAKKMATLTAISRELTDDAAVAVGEIVASSIARIFAKTEDQIAFLGDGTSTYWGLQGIVGKVQAISSYTTGTAGFIAGTGNAYSELTLADFLKVVGALPSRYEAGAKWYCNKYFFWSVMVNLAMSTSRATATEVLTTNGRQFLGYPVEYVPVMPKAEANSQICSLLADLRSGSYLGQRQSIEIAQSREAGFTADQIYIRGIQRVGINVYGCGGAASGGSAGPVCGLLTKAS